MKVYFSFIEEDITFVMDMDCIPRKGELISIEHIIPKDFDSPKDYAAFKEEEIEFRDWRVSDLAWAPKAGGESSVTIYLTDTGV